MPTGGTLAVVADHALELVEVLALLVLPRCSWTQYVVVAAVWRLRWRVYSSCSSSENLLTTSEGDRPRNLSGREWTGLDVSLSGVQCLIGEKSGISRGHGGLDRLLHLKPAHLGPGARV